MLLKPDLFEVAQQADVGQLPSVRSRTEDMVKFAGADV